MVSLEKWTKGIYYSCPHQQKGNNECIACEQNSQIAGRGTREGGGILLINSHALRCELCQVLFGDWAEITYKNINDKQENVVIRVDNCYEKKDQNSSEFICSNCKDKYEKLWKCPYCLKDKQNFEGKCCNQCTYGKTPQEINNKYQEYLNQVENRNNPTPSPSNSRNPGNGNSNNFNWTPLLIGAMVLILVGLITYFFMKKNKSKE